jgi:hypothetical protein
MVAPQPTIDGIIDGIIGHKIINPVLMNAYLILTHTSLRSVRRLTQKTIVFWVNRRTERSEVWVRIR